MPPKWTFRKLRPGEKDRQPTHGEFFATDAIASMGEALVRESIQNSLDAGLKSAGNQVRVRFHLATGSQALAAGKAQQYFQTGWPHFTADNNGLDEVPSAEEPCPFLVVEDFGTTGLVGDICQWKHVPGAKNPFYYFFRTEGRSGKGEEDRGRWGIGKYVFPRSSRIKAFIALTVREDDHKRLLMGQAVLKSHLVANDYYTPDGDYGEASPDELVVPSVEDAFLAQFSKDFGVSRQNEPGLSVVVPWIDAEITRENLLRGVIEDYFYPILCGGLEVTISTAEAETFLTKDTLRSACDALGPEFGARMKPALDLAEWARAQTSSSITKLNGAPPDRPKWDASLVPQERLLELREAFRKGEMLAVEAPLTVREKGPTPRESFFRMFLMNDGVGDGAPIFIRDGIIIPDVSGKWAPGVRSLVVIDDPPLAKLLGDSENPAHTQWQKDREHFRHKYVYGKSYIEFVSHSVAMFVRYLNEADQQPDRDLLRELFSVPKRKSPDDKKEKSKPRKQNKGETIEPDPVVESKTRRFTLSRVAGGFSVTNGEKEAPTPKVLRIEVAYDRRRGNPLKKYVPADFQMHEVPIKVEMQGAKALEKQRNQLLVEITAPDFRVTVSGFDENRDLIVKVNDKGAADDSQI